MVCFLHIFILVYIYPSCDPCLAYIINSKSPSLRRPYSKCFSEPLSTNSTEYHEHIPVMLSESMDYLITNPNGTYLDVTLGYGGHTEHILKRLRPKGNVIAIDRDSEAIYHTGRRLSEYVNESRLSLLISRFSDLMHVLKSKAMPTSDYTGIIADLGLSTHQLEKANRGFSYLSDGPLDMRMSSPSNDPYAAQSVPLSYTSNCAHTLINQSDEFKLAKIFREFGEEPKGPTIAKKIVEARRRTGTINTTTELRKIIISALPIFYKSKMKVLSRIFQALRIYVNDELNELECLMSLIPTLLKINGRAVILSYHSLEDRIIKRAFLNFKRSDPETAGFTFNILTKKCVTPTNDEIYINIRSRSAKLRCIEKVKYTKPPKSVTKSIK